MCRTALLTVPLGLVGAFAGLALMRAPLGFMALLGIVSLAGVFVSHLIGLLFGTLLTLLVLPTVYYVFATRLRLIRVAG